MFQFVCDRCKKPIEGSTYYTVDVYGHDINPTNDGRDSATTYIQNASENMSKMFCGEKHYCEECKNKIEDFLKMDDSKTLHFEQVTEQNKEVTQVKDYPPYLDRPKKEVGRFCAYMRDWIDAKENPPKEEGWYLVYTKPDKGYKSINKAEFRKGYEWNGFEPYWRGAGGHWGNVAYWMPLPEPPSQ